MPSFAFSIHNFISSVGADAGFAAIIGLAVLVLLYFAHARETANLREEAALLTQRLQQAEARVIQLTRLQADSERADAIAEEQASLEAAAMAPFAPVGLAAPALLSATRLVPAQAHGAEEAPEAEEPAAVPVPAMAMAGVGAPGETASAAAPAATAPAASAPAAAPAATTAAAPEAPSAEPPAASPPRDAPEPTAPVAPVPAAVPAPAPGGQIPRPATNAGGNGAGRHPGAPSPVPAPAPGASARAAASGAPFSSRALPPLEPPRQRRSRLGRGVAIALVALAAVAAAVVLFAVTAVGGTSSSSSTSASNTPSGSASAFKPSSVTVAVLNGTAVNQLAHRIADRLGALGYKQGAVATASNQTESTTTVAYLSGAKDRADALHVAKSLGLRRSAVRSVDQGTLQLACPTSTACAANVVVTVGADLASP